MTYNVVAGVMIVVDLVVLVVLVFVVVVVAVVVVVEIEVVAVVLVFVVVVVARAHLSPLHTPVPLAHHTSTKKLKKKTIFTKICSKKIQDKFYSNISYKLFYKIIQIFLVLT